MNLRQVGSKHFLGSIAFYHHFKFILHGLVRHNNTMSHEEILANSGDAFWYQSVSNVCMTVTLNKNGTYSRYVDKLTNISNVYK